MGSIPVFYDYCSPEAPPSRVLTPPGGAFWSHSAACSFLLRSSRPLWHRPHDLRMRLPLPPGVRSSPPPFPPASGRAAGGASRGRGQQASVGTRQGLVGFAEKEVGVASAETKPRVPGTGEGSGPGARWRPGRLRGLERRCLATGLPPGARPRSRSASPAPRPPPGHFCSARPPPDPRFHAVRVQNDAGKRVGVLEPGSVRGGGAGSAERV